MTKPALLQRDQQALDNAIRSLFARMLVAKDPKITLEDIEAICVPVQHRAMARDVIKLMGLSPVNHPTINIPYKSRTAQLETTLKGAWWFWPDRRKQPDAWQEAGEEVREKLLSWLKWREELGAQWALVQQVHEALLLHCTNAEQVRFFWPALPTLLDMGIGGKGTAAKMRGFKYPKLVPTLPPGLLQACTETMQTITKGLLFADAKEYDGPVKVSVYSGYYAFESRTTSWGRTYTTM